MVAVVAAGVLGWASTAGAASTIEVVTVVPGPDTATVVLGVRPPPSLTRPGVFRVEDADGGTLRVDTRAVLTPQLATGVVLDTSTAGADTLQGGVNGASDFLLQLPDGVSSTVLGDGGAKPTVLAPLDQGATGAIGGLNAARAGGDRHPGDALAAALAALPARTGTPRLLLLYTGAPDAGGEPAAALGRTLQAAGVLLAVVATGEDQRYWTEVAGATGGVLVSARGSAPLDAFTKVAQLLRERFVLTVERPATLPATLLVSVRIGTDSTSESVVVPADTAGPAPPGPAGSSGPGSGSAGPWWVLGVLLAVAVTAGAGLLARRRKRSSEPTRPLVLVGTGPPRPAPAGPRSPSADGPRAPGDSDAPGGSGKDGGPGSAGGPARTAPAERAGPRPVAHPAAGWSAAPTAATNPAADERAYGRLDDETGRVASLVAEGKLDRGHAVARIAMSAPGRIDLLDRVVDVERRLSGAQLGGSAPSGVVLSLLAAARRVVIGEVALVGPDGVRVEQVPAVGPDDPPVLTLTRQGRSQEFRGTKELGRHVDLHALTAESS